jgi:hypothetical protein
MPSTTAGSSGARGPSALRDRPLGRVAILAAVLLAAFLVSRSCGSSDPDISQERAIQIASGELNFEPECVQVRFLRRGLRSEPFWAVSLWTLTEAGEFDKLTVVLVNADSGRIAGINRQPINQGTQPQCESPV